MTYRVKRDYFDAITLLTDVRGVVAPASEPFYTGF